VRFPGRDARPQSKPRARVEACSQLVGERLVLPQSLLRVPDAMALSVQIPWQRSGGRVPPEAAISAPTSAARSAKFCGQFAAQARSCRFMASKYFPMPGVLVGAGGARTMRHETSAA